MKTDVLERGRVTDALITYLTGSAALTAAGLLIGDGLAPDAAGWPGGKVGTGSFVASVTLSTADALPRDRESIATQHSSWILQYGLKSVGAVRSQADHAADLVRNVLVAFNGHALPVAWHVTAVVFGRLGTVTVTPSSDPPLWEVNDVVQVWVDRQRTVT